jgi:hypothetical protein
LATSDDRQFFYFFLSMVVTVALKENSFKKITACQKEKLKRHARACVRACVRLTHDGAGKKKERKEKGKILTGSQRTGSRRGKT